MDIAFDTESLTQLIHQYGTVALFLLLALGIIALPVPEETLLVIAGVLMGNGILSIPLTILAVFAGSLCGITVSYMIGSSVGSYFVGKYGNWIGITELRFKKIKSWFSHYGKWTLTIGYFIPGVRHFTGITAGINRIAYKQFALFAYSGAFLWVATFLSIGYFCRNACIKLVEEFDINLTTAIFLILLVIILFYISKKIVFNLLDRH